MTLPPGTAIHATTADRYDRVLTPEALAFVVALQREFNPRRKQLLAARVTRQQQLDAGVTPRLPRRDRARSAKPPGPSRPSPPTSRTAASRSPAPSTAR